MTNRNEEEKLEITYYTDPLCCWSWAMEPQWRRLRFEFEGKITYRYRMGGLLPNWQTYNDPMNAVARPSQMGPVWMQAKHISGMPIQDKIWMSSDAPTSSYPACIAVKSAGMQGAVAAEKYLRLLREAVMIHGKNIAETPILQQLAQELEKEQPKIFSAAQFEQDWEAEKGLELFREDLQKVKYFNIGRFPTLTISKPGKAGVIITGYRPYEVLLQALDQVEPNLKPTQKATDPEDYKNYWGTLTERELQEVAVQPKEIPVRPLYVPKACLPGFICIPWKPAAGR